MLMVYQCIIRVSIAENKSCLVSGSILYILNRSLEILYRSALSTIGANFVTHGAQLSCRIHFLSHVKIQSRSGSFLLRRRRGDVTSNREFSLIFFSSWGSNLSSFFDFIICFRSMLVMAEFFV